MSALVNVQNERAASIEDTVQRGLGTLPQQAIFAKNPEGGAKISKPVQVCPACEFVVTLVQLIF